jgi:hypothetical protein
VFVCVCVFWCVCLCDLCVQEDDFVCMHIHHAYVEDGLGKRAGRRDRSQPVKWTQVMCVFVCVLVCVLVCGVWFLCVCVCKKMLLCVCTYFIHTYEQARQQLIVWLLWNACIRDQKNPVAFFQWCRRLYKEGILESINFLSDLGALQRQLETSFMALFGSESMMARCVLCVYVHVLVFCGVYLS